jgi:outer membrane protein assembly factor BamB
MEETLMRAKRIFCAIGLAWLTLAGVQVEAGPPGTMKWVLYPTGTINGFGGPAIGDDGTIYLAATDGNLKAIDPEGTIKWVFPVQASPNSPAIGRDGTIYLGSKDLAGC